MGCCETKMPPEQELQAYPPPNPPPLVYPQVGLAPPSQSFQSFQSFQVTQLPQHYSPPHQPFADFFKQFGIQSYYWADLMSLANFDIIMVLDDSGSMSQATENGTRWSELIEMLKCIVVLGGLLDQDGIDIVFLNRGLRRNITNIDQIQDLLRDPPRGKTPLSKRVREAMARKSNKQQLLLIATDGQPDADYPDPDSIAIFRQVLERERDPDRTFVSILKCSNNDDETGYLDKMDKELRNLDVIDDYSSEHREVLQKQGPSFVYTPGDNIARFLLGSIYPRYDNMDEKFVE